MSSAPTQLAVAPTAPSLVAPTAQIQKDFLEEPLTRQNSLGNRVRGSLKGKHLTRSHAMRESASPPHTPTPRTDHLATSPGSGFSSSTETINDSKVHVQSSSLSSSTLVSTSTAPSSKDATSVVIVTTTSQQTQQQQQQQQPQSHIMYSSNNDNGHIVGVNNTSVVCNQSQLDVDFPKLTPPKSSKCSRNSNISREQQTQQQQQNQSSHQQRGEHVGEKHQQFGIHSDHNKISYNNNNTNINSSIGVNATLNDSVTNVNSTTLNGKNNINNNNNNVECSTMTVSSSKQSNSHTNNNNNINNNVNNAMTTTNNNNNNNMGPSNPLNPVVTQSTSPNLHRNHHHHHHHHHQQQHQSQQTVEQNCNTNCNNSPITANSPISQPTVSPPLLSFDKENRCPRGGCAGDGNNIGGNGISGHNSCSYNNINVHDENQNNMSESPTDNSAKCERLGKKHRSGANAKGSKPRLKNMGSSSSVEGGNSTSGFISRDSSTEQYTDQSGVDLVQFFKETLNKNPKDRSMLMKIEKDLIELAHDKSNTEIRFPAMSSYNRMLIHRVAAFFGMEHNVDTATQQCVIVATTKSTRIPDIRFKSLFRDRMSDEPRKSILKRDTHSFDDTRHGLLMCPDRGVLDRKAKSFEEREEEYEKARRRIFRGRVECGDMTEEHFWAWSSSDSCDQSARFRQNNKLLKIQSLSVDTRSSDGRPSVSKSYSFGGYGGPPPNGGGNGGGGVSGCSGMGGGGPLSRGDSVNSTKSAGPRLFSKQDSIGSTSTWRLSPSSSGSLYHFDPSNLPPSQVASGMYNNSKLVGGGTMSSMHRKKVEKHQHHQQQSQQQHKSGGNPKPTEMHYHNANNNTNNNNNNNINNSNNNSRDSNNANVNESSVENLSESSAQTVLNVVNSDNGSGGGDVGDCNEDGTAKDNQNHTHHRDMSDIQEESFNQSIEEIDKPTTTATNIENLSDIQHKPKLKNQATSPNIPSPEPDQRSQINEITTTNENITDVNPIENTNNSSNSNNNTNAISTRTATITTNIHQDNHHHKKEDLKSGTSNVSITGYAATGYQTVDGTTIYSPSSNGPYPTTTYQQGPDGSVYAVPQPMVYAYPPPMDGEIQGYFMPVYDQSTAQRDPNGLVPATTQTIYQSAGGATAVVPVAYPSTPYGGAPLYQSQVIYSPDQFGAAASAAGQVQQYPVTTYPVGYPYPYNGYWGQTMTYYVPQPPLGNPVQSTLIPPPMAGSAACVANHSHNSNNNGNNGKRSTPPQQNLSSGHNSQSATPANTYQFAPGVPLALATDPSGPTMYAIPQSAVFPNMLPYAPQPNTPSATAGVLSHLPHHQHNAVINPLITTHPSGHAGPPISLEPSSSCGGYGLATTLTNSNGNHGNTSGTPQSAPSTPLSNPLPLPHHQRNPPLFATPPIIPNGYNTQMHNHYQSFTDAQNGGCNTYSSYDKKNSNNGGKKGCNNNNSGNGYIQNTRQNSYSSNNQQNQRKVNDNSAHSSSNPNGNNRSMHISQQQKRLNNDKNQTSISVGTSNSGVGNGNGGNNNISNNNSNSNNPQNNSDKPRTTIRPKPGNLDLRRSASQRNSPSTNSVESNNNSPNSIASNQMNNVAHLGSASTSSIENPQSMYMTRGAHIPSMHPPSAAAVVAAAAAAVANDAAACHQQLIGAYNHSAPGMYIKYGQTYFAHPSMALPNNRRSPPNDLRPPLTPLAGVYPTVNMMLPAPRQMQPRHPNPNYKGNKPSR